MLIILFSRVQLVLAPGLSALNRLQRHRDCNPIDIRAEMSDFSLTLNCAPESDPRFLLNVIELESKVFGTNARNSVAQELVMPFQKGIESAFDVRRRASFHFCHATLFRYHSLAPLRAPLNGRNFQDF